MDTEQQHPLQKIWHRYPGFLKHKSAVTAVPPIEQIVAELFSIGEFYFYNFDVNTGMLSRQHHNLVKMHGLAEPPRSLAEIIALTHPDDLQFVQEAEQMTVDKIAELGFEHIMNLKSGYCFRMRMASGAYEMIHHQSLPTLKSEEGQVLEAVNIHTNINHLSPKNNYTVTVSGFNGRHDVHRMQWPSASASMLSLPELSSREREVLNLLAKGCNSRAIGLQLHISPNTVRTHRRTLMAKMECHSSTALISKAMVLGLI